MDIEEGEHFTLIRASTVLIEASGKRILTDPWFNNHLRGLPAFVTPSIALEDLPPVDIVLASHLHPDHYDIAAVRKISHEKMRIIGPRGIQTKSRGIACREVIELAPGEKKTVDGFMFHAFEAKHTGPPPDEIVFTIDCDGLCIFFGGDAAYSDIFRQIGELYPVHIAFVPVGGTRIFLKRTVMDERDAIKACRELKTRYAVPVHEGGIWMSVPPLSLHPGRNKRFVQFSEGENFRSILPKYGERVRIPPGKA